MADSVQILRTLTAIVAVFFLLSGLDDLFVDTYYYLYRLYRRIWVEPKYPKLTEEDIRRAPEKLVAMMIPAWHEEAVIGKMLRHTLDTVDYSNFEIFVGTYPNDEGSMMAVAGVAERDPRIHRIVCPHDGPTNKADCMNWAFEGIRLHEKRTGKHFEIFTIQDSEDIVHPLSLKLFNYLMPRIHMVQLPVFPLEVSLTQFTAGTYLDEFAESHTKDLVVRERISRMVPSAGVGTALSRETLDELAAQNRGQMFNVQTLTEDYDLGFRLQALGKKIIIAKFPLERTRVVRAGWFRKREKVKKIKEYVATREYFPVRFRDAVRQKSRWLLGTVFQGWKHLGWRGDVPTRYMLWRDRKTLVSNFGNLMSYLLLPFWFAYFLSSRGLPMGESIDIIVPKGTWLWYVVVIDTLLMGHRLSQRFIALLRVSTWQQALISIPRFIWGNVINFTAAFSATRQFIQSSITGETLAWTKTDHVFPTEKELVQFKRRLGDLLLENRLVSMAQLTHAIEVQRKTGGRLGETLTRMGYVEESRLIPVLGSQLNVESQEIDALKIERSLLDLLPEQEARNRLLIPVSSDEDKVLIAAANPADQETLDWLQANLPRPHRLVLAGPQDVLFAIERAYHPIPRRAGKKLLGELLLEAGVI